MCPAGTALISENESDDLAGIVKTLQDFSKLFLRYLARFLKSLEKRAMRHVTADHDEQLDVNPFDQ